jgi:hypothetical protein
MKLPRRLTLLAAVAVTALAPAASATALTHPAAWPTGSPAGASAARQGVAASGSKLWLSRYRDGLRTGSAGNAVAASPDGSAVFVAGLVIRTVPGGLHAAELVAYDPATGGELWHARFNPAWLPVVGGMGDGTVLGAEAVAIHDHSVRLRAAASEEVMTGLTSKATRSSQRSRHIWNSSGSSVSISWKQVPSFSSSTTQLSR